MQQPQFLERPQAPVNGVGPSPSPSPSKSPPPPMTSSNQKLEKIMVMGEPGVGKTYQLLRIAQWLKPTGAQFYVADTDDRYARNLEEFPDLDNVHVTNCWTWSDFSGWLDGLLDNEIPVRGRDWMVVDRHEEAWTQARDEIDQLTYGESTTQRLIKARESNKRASGISEKNQSEWQLTKALYMPWYSTLMFKTGCHLWLTTGVSPVYSNDDENVKANFGWLGHKPAGRRDASHWPHTVLYFEMGQMDPFGNQQYLVTTGKDPARRKLVRYPITDIPLEYLAAIAGMKR